MNQIKFFICLTCLCILSPVNANDNHINATPDYSLKSGVRGLVDIGSAFWGDYYKFGANITYGYQFNSYLFLGAGVEIGIDNNSRLALPFFTDVKFTILNKKVTPFIDLRSGYDIYWGDFYLSPSIGCRFAIHNKGLNVSIGAERSVGMLVKLGFDF